ARQGVVARGAAGIGRRLSPGARLGRSVARLRQPDARARVRHPLRRRHRDQGDLDAAHRGAGLLQGPAQPRRARRAAGRSAARGRRRRARLWRRAARAPGAVEELFRLGLVHHHALRASRSSGRSVARLPVRPDAHPHHPRQLQAALRLPGRRALPLRHRQSLHAGDARLLRRQQLSVHSGLRLALLGTAAPVQPARRARRQDVRLQRLEADALSRRPEHLQLVVGRGRALLVRLQEGAILERPAVFAGVRRARRLLMRAHTIALALAVAGCGVPDLGAAGLVQGLRVLGVQAEPPEVEPGQQTMLTAWVADTKGGTIDVTWSACLLPSDGVANAGCTDGSGNGLVGLGSGLTLPVTIPDVDSSNLGPPDATYGVYLPIVAHVVDGPDSVDAIYRLRIRVPELIPEGCTLDPPYPHPHCA